MRIEFKRECSVCNDINSLIFLEEQKLNKINELVAENSSLKEYTNRLKRECEERIKELRSQLPLRKFARMNKDVSF